MTADATGVWLGGELIEPIEPRGEGMEENAPGLVEVTSEVEQKLGGDGTEGAERALVDTDGEVEGGAGAVLGDDVVELGGDIIEGLGPGDRGEGATLGVLVGADRVCFFGDFMGGEVRRVRHLREVGGRFWWWQWYRLEFFIEYSMVGFTGMPNKTFYWAYP